MTPAGQLAQHRWSTIALSLSHSHRWWIGNTIRNIWQKDFFFSANSTVFLHSETTFFNFLLSVLAMTLKQTSDLLEYSALPSALDTVVRFSPVAPLSADAISLQTSMAPTNDSTVEGSAKEAAPSVNTLATDSGRIVRSPMKKVAKAPNESWILNGKLLQILQCNLQAPRCKIRS